MARTLSPAIDQSDARKFHRGEHQVPDPSASRPTRRPACRNKSVKSELKTYVRRVREAVEAGDKDAALEHLKAASRKLDKAVSKGVIHKNQAANRKSKLAKRVASL